LVPIDPKAYTRDCNGNIIQLNDVVKVELSSPNRGRRGIVRNIFKSCLFLWDAKDKSSQSGGVFSDYARNLLLLGQEFFNGDENKY
jgi:hypothetical protein